MVTAAPQCPRCGYDQSGVIASWERAQPPSCPLQGTCSECGLEFWWRDVLRPHWGQVPWLYEHKKRWRVGFRRAWGTWRRTMMPRRFWSQVPLTAQVRPVRLVLWLVVLLVPLQAALGAANIAVRWMLYGPPSSWRPPGWWLQSDVLMDLASAAMGPWLDVYRLTAVRGPALVYEWLPLRCPYTVVAGLAISLLIPLELLVLASTRSDSRVRRGHVMRAAVYGLAWLVPAVGLELMAALGEVLRMRGNEPFAGWLIWLPSAVMGRWGDAPWLLLAVGAWTALWWRAAIVQGFRFVRGRLIWGLLMVGAGVLGLIVALLDMSFVAWAGKWLM